MRVGYNGNSEQWMGLVNGCHQECEWVERWLMADKNVTRANRGTTNDQVKNTGEVTFAVEPW